MLLKKLNFIQNCWVVPDLDQAMERWIDLGVGPFFRRDADYQDAIYRGVTTPLSFRGAIAQAGSVQIELIEQTSEGPSAYRDTVPKGESGFHHMLQITETFEEDVAALKARGIVMANEFKSVGDVPVVYADTRHEMGCMLELLPASPLLMAMFDHVAEAARTWDQRDAVRSLGASMGWPDE